MPQPIKSCSCKETGVLLNRPRRDAHLNTGNPIRKSFFLLFFVLAAFSPAMAQVAANFTVTPSGNCSPVSVSISNTTTGASAGATYSWDFGNGVVSTLKNPTGTIYSTEKTYTITLKVTDNGNTYTASKQVTVYKKPTVDFTASPVKGCVPLPVTLTSTSTAGDGTITTYTWDFGDGNTQQGSSQQISHTYNFAQDVVATLNVTNSYGCSNNLSKNIVKALIATKAAFAPNKPFFCQVTDPVTFTNSSTGPGTLSYSWDFGDGSTSTDPSPTHTYSAKNVYTVKLTVNSSEGCTDVTTQTVNIANFTSDFDVPSPVCQNSYMFFSNKSNPVPNSAAWVIDGSAAGTSFGSGGIGYSFYTTGTHTVTMTNTYGNCTAAPVTKTFTVEASPALTTFKADMNGVCGAPVTVQFGDNTPGAVKWLWNFSSFSGNTSTLQNPSYTYNADGLYNVGLTVTNAAGCSSTITKMLNIYKPGAYITYLHSSSPSGNNGCPGFTMQFSGFSNDPIVDYQWEFSDGGTSTDPQPSHTFNTPGSINVKLTYTTQGGCKGVLNYPVQVYKRPTADFNIPAGATICGSTPTTFQDASVGTVTGWEWNFGDGTFNRSFAPNPRYSYRDKGTFTVMMVASNGSCRDTARKTVTVLPPFPIIKPPVNTCAGNRGDVVFTENSKEALTWQWDFGDGSTSQVYNSAPPALTHTYTKTGAYEVYLTVTNGQCTVRDSMPTYVLLKQHPVLSSIRSELCSSDTLDVQITGLEANPADAIYYADYNVSRWLYKDGSVFGGNYSTNTWQTNYTGVISGLIVGKQGISAIVQSGYFTCKDTTNLLPLNIKGPTASFSVTSNNVCFKSPATFLDKSTSSNGVPIKTWLWTYGDNTTETLTQGGGIVSHPYKDLTGVHYVKLKVTDEDGCYSTTQDFANPVTVRGIKASFDPQPNPVLPNVNVNFYNNSTEYNTYNPVYTWIIDNATTTYFYRFSPSHSYPREMTDTVKLIAKDDFCRDTAVQLVYVKNVSASFTFTTTYLSTNNSCPPLLARFSNTSFNAVKVSWNFGDGSVAANQDFPSHTYSNAGIYRVILYAYASNGTVDTDTGYVTVKGPYAIMKADVLSGCTSQTVTLSADVKNATSFAWNFGDGTLLETTDTFAVHQYLTGGIYKPTMILQDGNNCKSISEMADQIVIDSLHIAFTKTPEPVCDSGIVNFAPAITSIAADQLGQPLDYHWDFGTGNAEDTSNLSNPGFNFNKLGKYSVALKVASPYGCEQQVSNIVTVNAVAHGSITAPPEACEDAPVQFSGSADIASDISWQWDFANGNQSTQQNPADQTFGTAGPYTIQLTVDHLGCKHVSRHNLEIRPRPAINASPKTPVVCLGNSVQLQAGGGIDYQWSPATWLSDAASSSPVATPEYTTTYSVKVTNQFGCVNNDSVHVTVGRPFSISTVADTFVCKGNSIHLPVKGAYTYNWIEGTALDNPHSDNPVATPSGPGQYTVVGYDPYGCYTDTATLHLDVKPLPTVNAGPDLELLTGSIVDLVPVGSADVASWQWTPGDYLSCTNCPAPVSEPRSHITYTVTVKTQYGCPASDTIHIKLICAQGRVLIPNSFTPNSDGKNDKFYIRGKGVRTVNSMRIYNRWGQLVFERGHFNINDQSAGWDGFEKGEIAPSGTYVYVAELVCDSGEPFVLKGTVTLVR